MPNLTIGRVGMDVDLSSVSEVSASGAGFRITGKTWNMSMVDATRVREQLLGYVDNPDESFIPLTSADMPDLNGYWYVRGIDASFVAESAFAGVLHFTLSVERVLGYASPLVEVSRVSALRSLDGTIVGTPTSANRNSLPAGAQDIVEWTPTGPSNRSVYFVRPGVDGGAAVTTDFYTSTHQVAPSAFYQGAASVLTPDGVVVGRWSALDPPTTTISNGVFQVEIPQGSAFIIRTRSWLGSGWSSWISYEFRGWSVTVDIVFASPYSINVMRNSPEVVTLRLRAKSSSGVVQNLDVSLRRGDRFAAFSGNLRSGFANVYSASIPSGTSPNNTGGVEYVVGSVTAFFLSTHGFNNGAGRVGNHTSIAGLWNFALGEVPNSGMDALDTADNARRSYWRVVDERQSVVAP